MLLFAPAPSTHRLSAYFGHRPPTIAADGRCIPRTAAGRPCSPQGTALNNVIVWVVGANGDQKLHGYDGDTGAVVYDGGGANELMAGTHSYSTTGIAARGRIYVANDNKVYAFRVPGGTPTPTPTPTATATATPRPPARMAVVADFNGDGHPDWVARNVNTRQTALVYLNDSVVIGAALGPTLAANLRLTGAADFNVDTHPDYALFAAIRFKHRAQQRKRGPVQP